VLRAKCRGTGVRREEQEVLQRGKGGWGLLEAKDPQATMEGVWENNLFGQTYYVSKLVFSE